MSHEIQLQATAEEMRSLQSLREPTQGREQALLGDGAGNLVGASGVPWLKVRLGGDTSRLAEAYNGTALVAAEGMSVTLLVRYTEGRISHYEIERLSNDVPYPGYSPGGAGGVAGHHLSHEYGRGDGTGGWDAVNVYERMITSLRPNAQATPNLTIAVAAGYYYIGATQYYYAGGNSGAFTVPGSGSEYHVVTLNAAGALAITTNGLTSPPVAFALASDVIPIAAVYLTAGQTTIVEADIDDIRPFLSVASGTVGLHNVLSATHSDTLAAAVVRGHLIVGNSTPKWAALAIGATNRVLRSNGTDPSWAQVVLTTDVSGVLPIANGGTSGATALAGFNALSPLTTRGDLLTRDATNNVRLAVGAATRLLQSDGTDPSWVALSGDATVAAGGALTLASTAVTPATYGDASNVAQVTIDAKGRITSAVNVPITGGGTATLIALARYTATALQTVFVLPDLADYIISITNAGLETDPAVYTLSLDGTTVTFDTGVTLDNIVVMHYVVLIA